jgi:hypothetical protein
MSDQHMLALHEAVFMPGTGTVPLIDVPTLSLDRISVEIAVSGNTLDAFTIAGKVHNDGSFMKL